MSRLWVAALLVAAATVAGGTGSVQTQPAQPMPAMPGEAEVRALCGSCHAFPPPSVLPRKAWSAAMTRMAVIRGGAGAGHEPLPDDLARALRYYEARAPLSLPPPIPWPPASAASFARHRLSPVAGTDPAIASVRFLDLDGDGAVEVVATDMRHGLIVVGHPDESPTLEPIGYLANPAGMAMTDFDGDGIEDLFVADLGQFLPSDHMNGAVAWLRGTGKGRFETLALEGWPRVAGIEVADLNGNGRQDVAVAAFGWRTVGNVTVLENNTTDYRRPSFVPHVIDSRPGAIRAIPADMNKDGHLDLVVLFAQQFEQVIVFVNDGRGTISFTPEVVYTAPHPNWGSSGIEVVDLDGDGRLDVLMTHGDTFDDDIIKPYHGVLWLENRGRYPFVEHRLAHLPGASGAKAGDLDGDGDLDVVAGAFIAGGSDVDERGLASLVWLEQVKPGVFERRTLETGRPRHATLDLADFDGDGDLDIAVGNFVIRPGPAAWVELWENRLADDDTR